MSNFQPTPKARATRPIHERLWEKIDRRGPDDCWPWTGGRMSEGYGVIMRDDQRSARAHRIVLEETLGRELSQIELACHTCDNPWCCNPAHLWVGTVAENGQDMSRKGRSLTGGKNGNVRNAKLTRDQVLAIRDDRRTQAAIAADYGISDSQVGRIKNGKRWSWL